MWILRKTTVGTNFLEEGWDGGNTDLTCSLMRNRSWKVGSQAKRNVEPRRQLGQGGQVSSKPNLLETEHAVEIFLISQIRSQSCDGLVIEIFKVVRTVLGGKWPPANFGSSFFDPSHKKQREDICVRGNIAFPICIKLATLLG